jgi:hypothetical protein
MIKYRVHPGYVWSRNDGQRHWVNAKRLMELHRVDPRECIVVYPNTPSTYDKNLIALAPQESGDYRDLSGDR